MRSEGHPNYYASAVTCAGCGSTFTIGSTIPEIKITICSNCHPFYTGKQKLIDTEGRIDRFKKKYAGSSMTGGAPDTSAS